MIKEKALLALMKSAYKHGGYKIMEADGITTIITASVAVIYKTARLPRTILGLIAEHTGNIPTDIAYDCSPTNGTQIVMQQVVQDIIKRFACHSSYEELKPTPLWWEERRIFQKDDGSVLGVSGEYLALAEDMKIIPVQIGESNIIRWQSDNEELYIAAQGEKDNIQLADLKYHQWVLL